MKRRLAKIYIHPEALADLLRGGVCVSKDEYGATVLQYGATADIPVDLKIIHVDWDFSLQSIAVICESESFEVVEEGMIHQIPVRGLTFTSQRVIVRRAL